MKKTTFLAAICCSLLTVGSLQAELPTPILDLPLNEETIDSDIAVAQANKSLPTATWDDDRGWVRKFTRGTSALQTTENLGVSGSSARTISYWIKGAWGSADGNNSTDHTVLANGTGGGTDGLFVILHKGAAYNNILFMDKYAVNTGERKLVFGNMGLDTQEWIHITFTIAEGASVNEGIKCYKNGVLAASPTPVPANYSLNTAAGPLYIGHSMVGSLSQLKVYDEELTAAQVAELYTLVNTTPDPADAPVPAPKTDAPFNEESEDPATTPAGFATGTPGYATDADHGNVRTFDGETTSLGMNAINCHGTMARTFSYWANLTDATHAVMFFNNANTTVFQAKNKIVVAGTNGYAIGHANRIDFENTNVDITGTWAHCVITIEEGGEASGVKCYVNGVKYADGNIVGEPAGNLFANGQWGNNYIFAKNMTGSASKFKFFNVVLSAEQVEKLYNAEKPEEVPTSIEENKAADCIAVQGKSIIVNGTADIQIYDATGRMTMQKNNVSGQMSVGNLQGIYMIRTLIDGQTATKKVVF